MGSAAATIKEVRGKDAQSELIPRRGRKKLPDDEVCASTRKMRMLRSLACGNKFEKLARAMGATMIAGVDEVGRGALFGPVVAETIDRVNIYQASRMAMASAVMGLDPQPDHLLIDALLLDLPHTQTKIIYGDSLSISIAAASVVAKVYRDRRMCEVDAEDTGDGLASHKGYATPEHRVALKNLGPSILHRKSFMPVAQAELPWDEFEIEEGPEAHPAAPDDLALVEDESVCPIDSSL